MKKLGDNLSKFYKEMQVALDDKVDELLFDDSVEDGLNIDFLEKSLVKEFIRVSPKYWTKRKTATRAALKKAKRMFTGKTFLLYSSFRTHLRSQV